MFAEHRAGLIGGLQNSIGITEQEIARIEEEEKKVVAEAIRFFEDRDPTDPAGTRVRGLERRGTCRWSGSPVQ